MRSDDGVESARGLDFANLEQSIRDLTADGYPAERVVQSVCGCGGSIFRLDVSPNEGCARRTCAVCGESAFICDSADSWDEAEPDAVVCGCGSQQFEIGVAFAFRDDGDVKWITVGTRCTACGVLGSPVDWKIDYGPTDHLLRQA
jgi:hypothetical protein